MFLLLQWFSPDVSKILIGLQFVRDRTVQTCCIPVTSSSFAPRAAVTRSSTKRKHLTKKIEVRNSASQLGRIGMMRNANLKLNLKSKSPFVPITCDWSGIWDARHFHDIEFYLSLDTESSTRWSDLTSLTLDFFPLASASEPPGHGI